MNEDGKKYYDIKNYLDSDIGRATQPIFRAHLSTNV